MLTRLLSIFLLLFTINIQAEDPETRDWTLITFDSECEEAKCIEENISSYKLLTEVGKRYNCFPPENATQEEIEEYYSTTMLNENCVRILAKLKEANDWWESAEATIASHLEEQSVNCDPSDKTPGEGIITDDMAGVLGKDEGAAPTCTEEKKAEVKEKNKEELWCIAKATFASSGFAGGIENGIKGCDDKGDDCLYQLATGFGNALWALWEGGKFLAQAAWSGIKNVAVSSWDWIWGNEEKTSDTGLALAEASEDDGVLSAILADPIGSMKKMWDGLMSMLGHWLSDDVFCQKWSGVPHSSECVEPFSSFACMSYASVIRGGCHIVGWALAEIVPAFLTGGIISAVKWGAKAGKALAKAIPVSTAVRTALKNSKLAQNTARAASAVVNLKTTQRLIGGSRALATASLAAIRKFMLSPTKKFVTSSIDTIQRLAKTAGSYKVVQGGVVMLKIGSTPVRWTGKLIWLYFDNPLTRGFFNAGIKLGPRNVVNSSVRASTSAAKFAPALEAADEPFKKMAAAQDEIAVIMRERSAGVYSDRGRFDDALRAFEESKDEYIRVLRNKRGELAPNLLKDDPNLKLAEVIDELYPELRYGEDLSRTMSAGQIRNAEREIAQMISKIDDPTRVKQLSMEFNHYRSNPARLDRAIDERRFFNPQEVYVNARLSPAQRAKKGFEIAGVKAENLTPDEVLRLKKGISDAHVIGTQRGAGVYEYTPAEIAQKYRTLREAGFSSKESGNLIRSGIAGDVPLELADFTRFNDDLFTELLKHVPEEANPNIYKEFMSANRKSLDRLIKDRKLSPQDLIFEKFKVFDHPNGKRYAYIKDATGDELIFNLDGKSMKFFGRDSYLSIEDFVKKNGPVFKDAEDGGFLVYSRKYDTDFPVLRRSEFKPPTNNKEFEALITEVMRKYPSADKELNILFKDFTNTHKKEIFEMLKSGKALPEEITPANFHRVMDTDLKSDVYLFLPKGPDSSLSDAIYFTTGKKETIEGLVSGRLGRVEMNGTKKVFVFEDGRFIDLSRNEMGFGSLKMGEGAITRKGLAESNFFKNMEEFAEKKLKGQALEDWKKMFAAQRPHLEEALVRQKVGPFDLAPANFNTFKGADGVDYGIFINSPFNDSVIVRLDGAAIADNVNVGTMREFITKVGGDIDFSDGSFIRTWNEGGVTKYHFTPKVERELRYLADDITRRFDLQARNGQRLNDDFINFVRENETLLKSAVRDGRIAISEIQPSSFARIVSDSGEEFFILGRAKSNLDTIIFPANKSITPPRGYLLLDELKNHGTHFKAKGLNLELTYNPGKSYEWSMVNGAMNQLYLETFSTANVIRRASLPLPEKMAVAERHLNKMYKTGPLTPAHKSALNQALFYGGKKGPGVFDYSLGELREIRKILKSGGFADNEVDYLIRSGIAARPPTRYSATATGLFADDFAKMTARTFDEKIGDIEKILTDGSYRTNPLSPDQAKRVKDNLEAIYFIDHRHSASMMYDVVSGKTPLHKSNLYARYNDTGAKAFENYQSVNRWLMEEKPAISMETFQRIQSRFMNGGVESIRTKYVGQVRDTGVIGNVTRSKPVTPEIIAELRANPYTDFLELSKLSDGTSTGKILYPNVSDGIKETALARIADTHPSIVEEARLLRDSGTELSALRDKLNSVPNIKRMVEDQLHALDLRKAELEGIVLKTNSQTEELLQVTSDIDSARRRLANIGDEIAQKQRVIRDEIHKVETKYSSIDQTELQSRLVKALTEERIDWYNSSRASLGALDSPEKVEKLIDLVAEFQRDLVSIHPFGNGNGRSTRQFALYYTLSKEGLPPPRILDPDTDLFKPLEVWKQEIKDGVYASQRLVSDLRDRAYAGLPLEDSMELLRPMGDIKVNKPMFRVANRKGAQEWFDGPELSSVNRDQFNHYVKEVLEERPILLQGADSDPVGAWTEIHRLAEERYLKNNVYFDHRPKSGNNVIREMSLGMPTDDFKTLFGRASYDDPFTYNYKMDKWYSDEINWRGLATFKGRPVKAEDDILDMFRELDPHMVSNDILAKRATDPESIRKAALANMEEMEKAAKMAPEETGDISDWAKWHSEATPPYYGRSIGYSTSKKESVGKAFGMGAMVNGKFGKLNKADKVSEYLLPDRQARLAQRLNVGTRRSIKDVEIEWMRSLRDNFRYSYGQQREVMGIGAADPDAIMIIKSYDDEGKVIESFVRNPEKPHEIWIVKGDADPGVKPPKGAEYRTIDLRQPRAPASPE